MQHTSYLVFYEGHSSLFNFMNSLLCAQLSSLSSPRCLCCNPLESSTFSLDYSNSWIILVCLLSLICSRFAEPIEKLQYNSIRFSINRSMDILALLEWFLGYKKRPLGIYGINERIHLLNKFHIIRAIYVIVAIDLIHAMIDLYLNHLSTRFIGYLEILLYLI